MTLPKNFLLPFTQLSAANDVTALKEVQRQFFSEFQRFYDLLPSLGATGTAFIDVTAEGYGATGNGSTDDYVAINKAHTAALSLGMPLLFPIGTYVIGTNLSFDASIPIILLGTLKPSNGITLTFDRPRRILAFECDQIFDISAGGTIAFTYKDWVTGEWFGAIGDDSTDCTAALQAALDSAQYVQLLAGTYRHTALDWPNEAGIRGLNFTETVLKYMGTGGTALTPTNATENIVLLEDFKLTDGATGAIGIDLSYSVRSLLERVWITGFGTDVRMYRDCYFNELRSCELRDATTCLQLGATGISNPVNHNLVEACRFQDYSTNKGIDIQGGGALNRIVGCDFESSGATGIYLTSATDTQILNCWFEVGAGDAIYITNGCLYTVIMPWSHAGGTGALNDNDQTTLVFADRQAFNRLNRQKKWTKQTISYAAAITPNPADGEYTDYITLTGNMTINDPASGIAGQEFELHFLQDGTGGRTLSWDTHYRTDFQPAAAADAFSSVTLRCIDGTWWQEKGSYNRA